MTRDGHSVVFAMLELLKITVTCRINLQIHANLKDKDFKFLGGSTVASFLINLTESESRRCSGIDV